MLYVCPTDNHHYERGTLMAAETYILTSMYDRTLREGPPVPMVTLDFELDVEDDATAEAAYFFVDFWLN